MLFAWRGLKIAAVAGDGFSKLLAVGLTFAFGLQAFVIIGGVTQLVPLTGLTLPFVSYGGSSVTANFALLALLLCISQRANGGEAQRCESRRSRTRLTPCSRCGFALLHRAHGLLADLGRADLAARGANAAARVSASSRSTAG